MKYEGILYSNDFVAVTFIFSTGYYEYIPHFIARYELLTVTLIKIQLILFITLCQLLSRWCRLERATVLNYQSLRVL
jgi:hypothetical protein